MPQRKPRIEELKRRLAQNPGINRIGPELTARVQRLRLRTARRNAEIRQECRHMYKRTMLLAPQLFDFVETIFEQRHKGKLHRQLVFLGRGSRPFYKIARYIARLHGIPASDIKLLDVGRDVFEGFRESAKKRRDIRRLMTSVGINLEHPVSFIDTGVIGTVPNNLVEITKEKHPKTPANGYLFFGQNVMNSMPYYSPSKKIVWYAPEFSPRETRALLETLPKRVLTVKKLKHQPRKKNRGQSVPARVLPMYNPEISFEIVGNWVVTQALKEAARQYCKLKQRRQ